MPKQPAFKRGEQTQILLELASVCTPFLSLQAEPWISVPSGAESHDCMPLHFQEFRLWLVHRFDAEHGAAPSQTALRAVKEVLHARCLYGNALTQTGRRVLGTGDGIVIDLANREGECVAITPNGWSAGSALPHFFRRGPLTASLPHPELRPDRDSSALSEIDDLFGLPSDAAAQLRVWLVSALRPDVPPPVLVLEGPARSGKSTLAQCLRTLLDPSPVPVTDSPETPAAVQRAAANHHLLVFEDVRHLSASTAGAIAHAAGQGHPVILVRSANAPALPAPLTARIISIKLTETEYEKPLQDLRRAFDHLRASALAELFDLLSAALRNLANTAPPPVRRLADAAVWAMAASPAYAPSPPFPLSQPAPYESIKPCAP